MPLPSRLLLALSLAFTGTALPALDDTTRSLSPEQIDAQVVRTIQGQGACAGQSCVVADLSGSTGALPRYRPVGGDEQSYQCIAKYNPRGVERAAKAPPVPNQHLGSSSALLGAVNKLTNKAAARKPQKVGRFAGRCAPNIVIFAKGTTEPGILGITVGPALQRALRAPQWSVVGVNYPADIPGDYCLGLPGGMIARDMLEGAAQKCPNSKIFVSGYSQGAMVAHNALGYASREAVSRVTAVVTFGDPFQGAPIKNYKGPILTFCNNGDAICTGNFELRAAHLAYTGAPAKQAIAQMKSIATGRGGR